MMRWLVIVGLLSGCTPNIGEKSLDVEDVDQVERKHVSSRQGALLARFKYDKKTFSVEWFSCSRDKDRAIAVLINPDEESYGENTCSHWSSQAFLSAGFNVVAINRPGFGKSTPRPQDFGGAATVEAIKISVSEAKKSQGMTGAWEGLWASGSGTIAASFAAKNNAPLRWLLLGNGIYDVEEFDSSLKDKGYRRWLDEAKKAYPSAEFAEMRSIGWDTSGLPKTIQIYHGKSNTLVSLASAQSFSDTLAAEEYKVHISPIKKLGFKLSPKAHLAILELELKRLSAAL